MEFAAQPGTVVKPKVTVTGPGGELEISAVTAVLEVGKIPVASITAPPEYSEELIGQQTSVPWTVTVSGTPVFTGYIGGPSGQMTSDSVSSANSLVNVSRDLDQSRMWSPGIHPQSMDDWTYFLNLSKSNAGEGEIARSFGNDFNMKNEISAEIIRVVRGMLKKIVQVQLAAKPTDLDVLKADAGMIDPFLARYYPKVPSIIDPSVYEGSPRLIPYGCGVFMANLMTQSRNANRSVWDTVQMMFASLGVTTVCDAQGKIAVMPILCGCKPPSSNLIDDNWITGYNYNSVYSRNVNKVLITSHATMKTDNGTGGSGKPGSGRAKKVEVITNWAAYPKDKTPDPGSGSVVMPLPPWLTPQIGNMGQAVDGGATEAALTKYAQSLYYEYRHAGRAVTLTTPFCPGAVPGTTIYFQTASKMRPFSGWKSDTGVKAGYLWKVVHSADTESRTFMTEWHIRSIYLNSEFGKMLDSPPFFDGSSRPFAL